MATRAAIRDGWKSVAEKFVRLGDHDLAAEVTRFAGVMGRPLTGESIARALLERVQAQQRGARTL